MAMKQTLAAEAMGDMAALFNPKPSIFIQERHPYARNLTQKPLGTVKTPVLCWGGTSHPFMPHFA